MHNTEWISFLERNPEQPPSFATLSWRTDTALAAIKKQEKYVIEGSPYMSSQKTQERSADFFREIHVRVVVLPRHPRKSRKSSRAASQPKKYGDSNPEDRGGRKIANYSSRAVGRYSLPSTMMWWNQQPSAVESSHSCVEPRCVHGATAQHRGLCCVSLRGQAALRASASVRSASVSCYQDNVLCPMHT